MNTEDLPEKEISADIEPSSLNRRQRRRIAFGVNPKAVPAIEDELAFSQNKCSPNTRKIGSHAQNTNIDFYIDKHYHIRANQGDNMGKREGIEPNKVYLLVKKCIPHLILYSSIMDSFSFLNFDKMPKPGRNLRVVCQGINDDDNQLNVVIECHVVSLTDIEITIVTAIQKNDYLPSDGQYSVLIDDCKGSELFYCSKGKQGLAAKN
jgi:hypothetical protein